MNRERVSVGQDRGASCSMALVRIARKGGTEADHAVAGSAGKRYQPGSLVFGAGSPVPVRSIIAVHR